MKLQDNLPQGVEINGHFYKLDFDFRNVLRMMEVLQRDDLMPDARAYNAIKCLTKHPRNCQKVLEAVRGVLFEKSPSKDGKKVTDFEQDAGLIRSAFRQAYGIDLFRDKLHWLEFAELLRNIPEGNRYAEVIGIRIKPLPKPNKWNAEERQRLMQAKNDVAIHLSEQEQAKKYEQDVSNIFAGLLAIAKRGEGIG